MPSSPCRTMSVRGAQNCPLFCCRTCRRRGCRAWCLGHVGARAGKDPAPPGNRRVEGLRPLLPTPRPRRLLFSFQFSWQLPRPQLPSPADGGREGPAGSRGARCLGRPGGAGRTHVEPAPAGVARPRAHSADALTWRTHLQRARAARREKLRSGCGGARARAVL